MEREMMWRPAVVLANAIVLVTGVTPMIGAQAGVVISTKSTENMTCSYGVCSPTAASAVLNNDDLQNMLAVGNVTVVTTGNGIQASNIVVSASFGWSTTSAVSLDAFQSITINGPISVNGLGALSLATDDGGGGGALSFGKKGHIAFQNLSNAFTINGLSYLLVNSIASLADAVTANPAGAFALAGNYDAQADGTYTSSPIDVNLTGTFDGLGNTISNLSMENVVSQSALGLFATSTGMIRNFGLLHVSATGSRSGHDSIGTIVGGGGSLVGDFATGKLRVRGSSSSAGGLAGEAVNVDRSHADVSIESEKAIKETSGGLVGVLVSGVVSRSYASGTVGVGDSATAGGLVGRQDGGDVQDSYATGTVTGGLGAQVGGLIGQEDKGNQTASTSYSAGAISGGTSSLVGGFVGKSTGGTRYNDDYWDTTTSGTDQAAGGGRAAHGIAGLTTEQLQSGLPSGFDPTVWAEDENINGGLPYLIANPPRKN